LPPPALYSCADPGTKRRADQQASRDQAHRKPEKGSGKAGPEHQSSWNIQIGAFPTAEGAKSRIDAAKSSRVSALRDATPFLMAVDKNGDTIYRARFSG
jgi:cell division septation protein DedD